jgi:hypothetical protein
MHTAIETVLSRLAFGFRRRKSTFMKTVFAVRLLPVLLISILMSRVSAVRSEQVYSNSFSGPIGTTYPEWTSAPITYTSATQPPRHGRLPAPEVATTESPNHVRRFLGEFGGPAIGKPGDAGWNRARVEQTVSLALRDLPAHAALKVSFDLLILKSWDGNSPTYGPDRWNLAVSGGPTLLATTFSNNPKVATEGSHQDYPKPQSAPRTGAVSTGTLGYDGFFKDSIYRMEFIFPHSASELRMDFQSSLFEGKGAADESWGLANVVVETVPLPAPKTREVNP